MEWEAYREIIESPEGEYRTNVPALFPRRRYFETFVDDLARLLDPTDIKYVAGIGAMRYIPGTALARRFDVGFVAIRKDQKLPIREEQRIADDLVDYTCEEKTLEVDIRQVPTDRPTLIVDNWMETASQVQTTIDLIELPDGEVGGIAY